MNITTVISSACIGLCVAITGCKGSNASAAGTAAVSSQAVQAVAAPAVTKQKVIKIAFMDKEHACDCTKKRVDAGWSALQTALAGRTDIAVERIHSDTEEAKVAPYQLMRAMVALPAVYFLDEKGALNEMLQGDLTAEQIGHVLN